nr:NADH dehydrogenase subunit 2 [Macrophya dolichogaster]
MTKYFFNKNFISNLILMKTLFFMTLMFSSIIVINSSTWMSAWMGLEINLISFIPLMMNNTKKIKMSNSMMIYFIIQAGASSMLMMSIIFMKIQFNLYKINSLMNLIQLSLLMKLGASPFHWWTPKIFLNLNWTNCLIFLTWQKIAPLFLLLISNNNLIIYMSALMSTFMGALLGMNQSSIKMILIYSSINHLGWLLMSMMMNKNILIMYFIFYSMINMMISFKMNNLNIIYINQLFKNNNQNMNSKMIMMSLFMSLAGMPPLLGFLPKILTLIFMLKENLIMEMLMFIILSVLSLSFYINPLMSILLISKNNSKWMSKNFNMNNMMFSILTINMMILLIIMYPLMNMLL